VRSYLFPREEDEGGKAVIIGVAALGGDDVEDDVLPTRAEDPYEV